MREEAVISRAFYMLVLSLIRTSKVACKIGRRRVSLSL